MVQIISGKKGKGKTKYLLDSVNGAVASAQGSVVYLDKTAKHMYELSNKVRLIIVSDYGTIPMMHLSDLSAESFLRIMILRKCILIAS